jgi:PAS domain S-box-containing protein
MPSFYNFFPAEDGFVEVKDDLLSLLFELEDYGITMFNADGYVISSNIGAEKIYRINREELIGRHFSSFYSTEQKELQLPGQNLSRATEEGRIHYDGWKNRVDGSVFYANVIITSLKNKTGVTIGFAKIIRDITVQKKLEEENRQLNDRLEEKVQQRTKQLEAVNKELEAFSYSVSHDLRTPLRAIAGYGMMLQEDYYHLLDAEGQRIMNVILKNTGMMSELIDDLLTFSKLSRLEVIEETVNMRNLLDECLQEQLQVATRKDYDFTIHEIPDCKGDKSMLRQVWANLLGNAIKYSSKTTYPQVEVGARCDNSATIYYLKDNGTGFDMKYSNKLFGVFQRLHRHDEFEGTGLGLALAKRIVNKHGGEIWAEASVNAGATFYFSIPKN